MFRPAELVYDKLNQQDWLGEVVDINDPLKEGRVRVRVFGKFDELDVEDIPFARPSAYMFSGGSKSGSGSFSLPKLGSIVNVRFENNNLYCPVYTYLEHISDELKKELEGDNYATAQSLVYDTESDLKIFYTKEKGLVIKHKQKLIRLYADGSLMVTNKSDDAYESEHNFLKIDSEGNLYLSLDKDAKVEIGGNSDIYIKGNHLFKIEGDSGMEIKGNSNIKVSGSINIKSDSDAIIEVGGGARIKANTVVQLDCSNIKLGKKGLESVIKGETFQSIWNAHFHIGNLGYPTGGTPVSMASALSKNTKTD